MTIITIERTCEHCNGEGCYDEDQGGYSSHSLNQYFLEVTCIVCKGERTVPVDICAGCKRDVDDFCECPEVEELPFANACVALARIIYCFECREPTTGSLGQAGFFWRELCQPCKDRADGVVRAQVLSEAIVIHAINRIA